MTAFELAGPVDTIAARCEIPSRHWSTHRKLQRRQERYSKGANCPEGHPWSQHAKFNYRGYRLCGACAREKADKRLNDPATFTGACPKGHLYTRENTIITNWNTKLCLTCKRIRGGQQQCGQYEPSRPIPQEKLTTILVRAKAGASLNALCGRNTKDHEGKGITNRPQLIWIMNNLEGGQQIKEILASNDKANRGRKPYKWSDVSSSALKELAARPSLTCANIAETINDKFGTTFTGAAVWRKTRHLGITRPKITIILRRLPPISTSLHFPEGSLLARINAVVPRYLARDHRDDVIGEMALAVYEGFLLEADIERRFREFVNVGYRRDHDKFGAVSLDAPLFDGTDLRRIDLVSESVWQQA